MHITTFLEKIAIGLVEKGSVSIGVVLFSRTAQLHCQLTSDLPAIQQSLRTMTTKASGANFSGGLNKANEMLLDSDTRFIVLLTTDEDTSKDPKQWENFAARMRNDGVTIFAVGIGKKAQRKNLNAVAGSAENATLCADSNALQLLANTIIGKIKGTK